MSQRLHIGKTDDQTYDCVISNYESTEAVYSDLSDNWLMHQHGVFVGPWKIRIGDWELWLKVQPVVERIFDELSIQYPDSIWAFYYGDSVMEHPTKEELLNWQRGCSES